MSNFSRSLDRWQLSSLLTLTTVAGLQLLRAMLPLLLYVLRDRFGWNAIQIGLLAIGLFLLSYLAAPLARLLGPRRLLAASVTLVALCRLMLQLWTGDPLADLPIALVGTLAFGLCLPPLVGLTVGRNTALAPALGLGVLGGLALDLGLHGLYGTYDLHWRPGLPALLIVGLLAVAQLGLLFRTLQALQAPIADPGGGSAAWIAIGPLLFLYLLSTGNLAALTTLSGWTPPLAFLLLMLAHLLGLSLALWPPTPLRQLTLIGVVLLLVWLAGSGLVGLANEGWLAGTAVLALQVTLAGLWLLSLRALLPAQAPIHLRRLSAANGSGLLLLTILLFIFYASYDIPLPVPRGALPIAALLLLTAVALTARRAPRQVSAAPWRPWLAAFALLLLFPAGRWLLARPPETAVPPGQTLRVMTYNLHNGFNPQGNLDLEALAQTIESQQADVVGLQEVSRGWVVNGSVDMLAWLAQRLDMTAVFAPTSGPLWGNAVLSRVPIAAVEQLPLPPADLLLQRGVLKTELDLGPGRELTLLTTHYHHVFDDSAIRVQQSNAILAAWPETRRAVLLGDMNATPDSAEMSRLRDAGWRDVLAVTGVSPGYTYPTRRPSRRIDYIWITPDLTPRDAVIPPDPGSDHLAVVVTLE